MEQLEALHHKIGSLEQLHNEILDQIAHQQQNIEEKNQDLRDEIQTLRADLSGLQKELAQRVYKAKRATVILSLLAQNEEVAPVANRINTQPYEQYADREWFKSQLK